jgi:methylation protein EvaC
MTTDTKIAGGSAPRIPDATCRVCGAGVLEFLDLGRQPLSNTFPRPEQVAQELYYRLAVGFCTGCTMVQQLEEVPRRSMFHEDYPYRSSSSESMAAHFQRTAEHYLRTELAGPDPFVVEIGSNDGIMLKTVAEAGVRHLGVDPSDRVSESAATHGVKVLVDFFDEDTAAAIREEHGPADLIFSSNTTSHITSLGSVLRGVETLFSTDGILVLEDRYLGDIVEQTIFDQIYDEHFYLFAVRSVRELAARHGLELVNVEHLPVHGGSIRYTIARPRRRPVDPSVDALLAHEERLGLGGIAVYERFAANVHRTIGELAELLTRLRAEGHSVVGYGATAKSATVTNHGGIGTALIPYVCDSIKEKQGRVTPGSHLPVVPSEAFRDPYPDYAVLFAWSHAEEILAKESAFTAAGGQWITYVPELRII